MRNKGSRLGYLFKRVQTQNGAKIQTTWSDVPIPYRYDKQERVTNNIDITTGVRKKSVTTVQVSYTQVDFDNDDKVSDDPDLTKASRITNVRSKDANKRGSMHRKNPLQVYTFEVS